jgi:two-component system, OmpR family, response regulator
MGRPKILLVDDNEELLRLLARLMESEGFEAVPCSRGRQATEALRKHQVSVAVVDVLLPDMMGYDVGSALRKDGIPFVLMTGIFKGGRAASEARIQHGAAGYFEKPFEARRLVDTVRGLLPKESPGPATPAPAVPPSEDFDVELAVEAEEPVEPMELTGKVSVQEDGGVSALIRGEELTAAGVGVRPSRAEEPPLPPSPPRPRLDPPDEGELHDNLPELVTAFWLTQQTGELALHRGKVKKAIFFEKGRPCFAISNLVADRFGPFLVRVGKLTAPQLELCEAAAQMKGRKAGEVLVEMGILKETEKLYYLAQQLKAIAYSLFAWEDGSYRLHFTDRAAQESMKLDLPPPRLIWRGVKKLYRPERLARLLPAETRLIPTQQPAYGLHEVELEEWEAHLISRVDGRRTVGELVALAKRPESAVRAMLWGLCALEILARYGG